MSKATPSRCPSCGATGTGRFCASCGQPMAGAACHSCGAALSPGARFCPQCGAAAGAAAPATAATAPRQGISAGGIAIGALAMAAVAALVWAIASSRTPTPAGGGVPTQTAAGVPPDISQMTPRERFTRLADRVQTAAENNDQAQFQQFFPMVEGAWAQLLPGDRDIDARFHFGLLQEEAGNLAAATAQADSILAEVPDHLFGWYLKATIADAAKQPEDAKAARQAFDKAYDAQMATGLPEYAAHQELMSQFRQTARIAN